jgi:haloalkane dehalogenase
MIPTLLAGGHRIVAPDLIGFGRSDKPVERSHYTYARHVAWMREFLDHLVDDDPSMAPLDAFVQDWGGLIGLRLAAEHPTRFGRLVVANTALPHGESLGPGFDFWLEMSQTMDPFDCGELLDTATSRSLSEREKNAYRAPFPDETYLAGAREFPTLVPITPDHPGVAGNRAAREVLAGWTRPVLALWGRSDGVLGHLDADLLDLIPGTAGQPHREYPDANHFIQDDVGAPLADVVVDWLSSLDAPSS